MIQQIENTQAQEATQQSAPARNVEPATPAGKSFASVLAREKRSKAADETQPAEKAPKHPKRPIEAPEGEVWRPVRGNDNYARIVEGPRAGQYVNLSRGERRGEVFRVEMREGKRVHVYGEGAAEKVIEAAKDSGRVPDGKGASGARVPKGEQWAPVDGVSNYADILNGRRNGYYVNTSGGVRDGMVFQIVKKGDRTYHVYGAGKHKQWIEVGHADNKKDDDKKSDGAKSADATTGGARAPSSTR